MSLNEREYMRSGFRGKRFKRDRVPWIRRLQFLIWRLAHRAGGGTGDDKPRRRG
jgi:hypothetical protein